MNKQLLIGNVGGDPEEMNFDNGNKIAKLSLATTETWKDKNGERQSKTTWHNLIFSAGLADVVMKYVKKGDKLYVEGKTDHYQFQNSEGETRYGTQVRVREMKMISTKKESTSSEPEPTSGAMDDLPF